MKASYTNGDITLFMNKLSNEMYRLKEGPIETILIDSVSNKKMNKKVTLIFGNHKHPDGIQVLYLPEGEYWRNVKEIQITITDRAYTRVAERDFSQTRFQDFHKVTIINDTDYDERWEDIL